MSELALSGVTPVGHVVSGPASTIVRSGMESYTQSIIETQFPTPIDGLKRVHVRFLYALAKGNLTDARLKSGRMVTETTNLHPHGDASIYDVIASLAQIWTHNPKLVDFFGNVGSYTGGEPGAMRYTEMALAQFARDVFFQGIDVNALAMKRGASGGFEPAYFVPCIPTALLYPSFSVGAGYQSKTCGLWFRNLCDLTIAFCEHVNATPLVPFPIKKYCEYLLPEFPTLCVLTNKNDLVQAYRQGTYDARICVDGVVELFQNKIIIRSLPPLKSFKAFVENLRGLVDTKGTSFDKQVVDIYDLSTECDHATLDIPLKNGVSPFDVLKEIVPMSGLYGSWVPNTNYSTPDNRIINLNYYEILYMWYKERRMVVMTTKRKRLKALKTLEMTLEAHLKVVNHTDKVIKIIRSNDTETGALILAKTFNLTSAQANALLSLGLRALSKTSGEEIKQRLAQTVEQITALVQSFSTVGEEIAQTVRDLKAKYASSLPRRTHVPNYVGSVEVEGGSIQYETPEEVMQIAENFPKGKLIVRPYNPKSSATIIALDASNRPLGKWSNHKYLPNGRLISYVPTNDLMTIDLQGKSACAIEGFAPGPDGLLYTRTDVTVISRKGMISQGRVPDLLCMRKTVGSKGAVTDITHVWDTIPGTYYVAFMSTRDPNVLTIYRVGEGDRKIPLPPVGQIKMDVSKTGKGWFINVDPSCLNRYLLRTIYIKDANAIIPPNERFKRLELNTNAVKREKKLFKLIV